MHGADFLLLDPAKAPTRGLTVWLTGELRAAITDGRLAPGATLPATRVLARELGVSRGVVVDAYQRLADEGLTDGRPGTGTRVLAFGVPQSPDPAAQPSGTAQRPATGAPAAVDWTCAVFPMQWGASAEIDLSPGVPDLSGFPRAAWLRAEKAVLAQAGTADLSYPDPRGNPQLREALSGWLAGRRGLRVGPDDVIVVAGVAQSLALLARVLRERDNLDRVAVEDPGSRGSRDELAHWGLRPVPVPVDDQGLQVDELERTGADAVLLTPAHQFPTGVVLGAQRRRELVRWAAAG